MVLPGSSPPKTSISRVRSWLVLSSPVSITRSARSRKPLEQEPLVGDGVDHPPGRLRVTAAGAFEPPDQHVVGARPGTGCAPGWARPRAHPPPGARRRGRPRPGPTTKATRSISDPVPSTSSETLEIRAEGMLSITNQPRSSRVAPAVDRPAPDMPVTTRYSLTASTFARFGGRPVRGQRGVQPLEDRRTHLGRQPR